MNDEIITTDEVKRRYRIQMDEAGCPVMLADVPGSGVAKIDPDAESGNPRHDTRSGKFAPGRKAEARPPANVDPMEFRRYMDAIRDAAREMDNPDIGDIQEFIQAHAQSPDKVDAAQFLAAVQEQRKSDLVDILDQQMRSSGILPRGRRRVRLSAPKGYVRRILGGLDEDTQAEVMARLEARGHDREDVDKFFDGKTKNEGAKSKRDSIAASNDWQGERIELDDDWHYKPEALDLDGDVMEFAQKMAQGIVSNLPQPVVTVEPHIVVEAPKPTRREIIRDEKTGLAVGVVEVPEEDGTQD